MAAIFLITFFALFGVFGTTQATTAKSSDNIMIEVEYPVKFRYKTISPFEIKIENVSSEPHTVTVTVNTSYLSQFSNASFVPPPQSITDEVYTFELGTIDPGAVSIISGEIQSENYGRIEGFVRAQTGTSSVAAVEVITISLP